MIFVTTNLKTPGSHVTENKFKSWFSCELQNPSPHNNAEDNRSLAYATALTASGTPRLGLYGPSLGTILIQSTSRQQIINI